jgi:riboflavin biosynthesis pyrimidine reductase
MLPHVTIFNAMSVDGRMDWYLGDMDSYAGFYYGIAARWEVQAVLAGSATMRHPEPEIDPPDAVADPRSTRPMTPGSGWSSSTAAGRSATGSSSAGSRGGAT